MSDSNPNRLYIYESTARGFNMWNEMWEQARNDPHHCKCIFLGWWSKDSQQVPRDHFDFKLYGETPPSDDEIAKIKRVKEMYGHDITQEQLAWIRKKMDPTAQREGDADPKYEGNPLKIQEQPWDRERGIPADRRGILRARKAHRSGQHQRIGKIPHLYVYRHR